MAVLWVALVLRRRGAALDVVLLAVFGLASSVTGTDSSGTAVSALAGATAFARVFVLPEGAAFAGFASLAAAAGGGASTVSTTAGASVEAAFRLREGDVLRVRAGVLAVNMLSEQRSVGFTPD